MIRKVAQTVSSSGAPSIANLPHVDGTLYWDNSQKQEMVWDASSSVYIEANQSTFYINITADYLITSLQGFQGVQADSTSGPITVMLPLAASAKYAIVKHIVKVDSSSNAVTIGLASGDSAPATLTLSNEGDYAVLIRSASSQWQMICKGNYLIKRAAPGPDSAPIPNITYVQSDIQKILDELCDLKTVLRVANLLM